MESRRGCRVPGRIVATLLIGSLPAGAAWSMGPGGSLGEVVNRPPVSVVEPPVSAVGTPVVGPPPVVVVPPVTPGIDQAPIDGPPREIRNPAATPVASPGYGDDGETVCRPVGTAMSAERLVVACDEESVAAGAPTRFTIGLDDPLAPLVLQLVDYARTALFVNQDTLVSGKFQERGSLVAGLSLTTVREPDRAGTVLTIAYRQYRRLLTDDCSDCPEILSVTSRDVGE